MAPGALGVYTFLHIVGSPEERLPGGAPLFSLGFEQRASARLLSATLAGGGEYEPGQLDGLAHGERTGGVFEKRSRKATSGRFIDDGAGQIGDQADRESIILGGGSQDGAGLIIYFSDQLWAVTLGRFRVWRVTARDRLVRKRGLEPPQGFPY